MLNPFAEHKLAESIPAKHFLRLYSPEVLKSSDLRRVTNRETQYVVGTPGSGKTMLLRLLTFAVQREIESPDKELDAQISALLSHRKLYVGVYFTFDQPRIGQYGSGRLGAREAGEALHDFVGTNLAHELIHVLDDNRISRIGSNATRESRDETAQITGNSLMDVAGTPPFHDWSGMKAWLEARLRQHIAFQGWVTDKPDVNGYLHALGLVTTLAESARATGLLPDNYDIFVVLDQADKALVNDGFARVLKQTIDAAARTKETRIHVKVGLRKISVPDIERLATDVRIDTKIEEIDVNVLGNMDGHKHTKFLRDICAKRVRGTDLEEELQTNSNLPPRIGKAKDDLISRILQTLPFSTEANEAITKRTSQTAHIDWFVKHWENLGIEPKTITTIRDFVVTVSDPIEQMIILIDVSKKLSPNAKSPTIKIDEYRRLFVDNVTTRDPRRLRTKYTEPAMYLFLRILGRKRKQFCGFDQIAAYSERNNVRDFLTIMAKIIDEAPRDKSGRIELPISVDTQTDAVYEMSEFVWSQMEQKYTHGIRLAKLISTLGADLRQLLAMPNLPVLSLCGFDMPLDPDRLRESIADATRMSAAELDVEAVNLLENVFKEGRAAGFLRTEQTKGNTVCRVWINRFLLPRLGLPSQSQQETASINVLALAGFFGRQPTITSQTKLLKSPKKVRERAKKAVELVANSQTVLPLE